MSFLAASGKAACELLGLAVMDGAGEEQVRWVGWVGGAGRPWKGADGREAARSFTAALP